MPFSQYHSQQENNLAKVDRRIFWPKNLIHIIWTYQINLGQIFIFLKLYCEYLIIQPTIDLNVLVESSQV